MAIGVGGQKIDYFGIIEDIWELDYGTEALNVAYFNVAGSSNMNSMKSD